MLARCRGGIIYLPGAAGTVQEVFQAVTENYYAADAALIAPMVLGMGDAKTLPAVVLMAGSFGGEVLIAALLGIALLSGALGMLVMTVTRRSGVRFALGPVLLAGPFLGLLGAPLVRAALGGA